MKNDPYENWLAERRSVSPSDNLPNRIMGQVAELERQQKVVWWLSLVQQIEHSRGVRWAACAAALAIGGSPFLFLAYVSKFLTF